ncbi:hypothetical protein LTS18_001050, partial [Coniosporium uncinatum]
PKPNSFPASSRTSNFVGTTITLKLARTTKARNTQGLACMMNFTPQAMRAMTGRSASHRLCPQERGAHLQGQPRAQLTSLLHRGKAIHLLLPRTMSKQG